MWTCRNCGVERDFSDFTPEIDSDGHYFICPACSYRNILLSVDGDDDSITLVQPDIHLPSGKPGKK